MDTRTREEMLRDFETEFGFVPVPGQGELSKVHHDMEQRIVLNELRNVMHLLADAKGDRARLLRLKLERMRRDGRLMGFKVHEIDLD